MKNKLKCHLLSKTPLEDEILPLKPHFKLIKILVQESHLFRYILECRQCGQLYFYEFYEQIDWEKGNDPQYTTYIPIENIKTGEELNKKSPMELLMVSPRLQNDFNKEGIKTIKWIK